ncbi:hypothetical protein CR513_21897, partial [Mucuna pruriens]
MLLLQEFDLEIRDKKGVENLVAYHLSQIKRGIDPLSIRDDFPDEQIFQMDKSEPWFVDTCNFLVASTFLQGASKSYKEKIEGDAKYYIWDDPYLWKLCRDQIIRRCILDAKIQSHLEAAITDQIRWPKKYSTVGFIGPPFSKTLTNMSRPANSVCEQEWPSTKGMKCPNSRLCFVKFGVPEAFISDHGSHFWNSTMSTLVEKYGVVYRVATTYHP